MIEDCCGNFVYSPELPEALAFLYTMDNGSPPSAADVTAFWTQLQARFPHDHSEALEFG